MVGDNGAFLGKPLHVLGLLGQEGHRDEEGEVGVLRPRLLDPPVQLVLELVPYRHAPRSNHHTSLDGTLVHHLSCLDHVLVPLGVVGGPRSDDEVLLLVAVAARRLLLHLLVCSLLGLLSWFGRVEGLAGESLPSCLEGEQVVDVRLKHALLLHPVSLQLLDLVSHFLDLLLELLLHLVQRRGLTAATVLRDVSSSLRRRPADKTRASHRSNRLHGRLQQTPLTPEGAKSKRRRAEHGVHHVVHQKPCLHHRGAVGVEGQS
mmetsp:Transcript_31627/g.101078  ORF Transcript_31627/g.101078 Transcript_31627/m.101078 type:complete len:261 (+) Transcript_31627:1233-2015(+)